MNTPLVRSLWVLMALLAWTPRATAADVTFVGFDTTVDLRDGELSRIYFSAFVFGFDLQTVEVRVAATGESLQLLADPNFIGGFEGERGPFNSEADLNATFPASETYEIVVNEGLADDESYTIEFSRLAFPPHLTITNPTPGETGLPILGTTFEWNTCPTCGDEQFLNVIRVSDDDDVPGLNSIELDPNTGSFTSTVRLTPSTAYDLEVDVIAVTPLVFDPNQGFHFEQEVSTCNFVRFATAAPELVHIEVDIEEERTNNQTVEVNPFAFEVFILGRRITDMVLTSPEPSLQQVALVREEEAPSPADPELEGWSLQDPNDSSVQQEFPTLAALHQVFPPGDYHLSVNPGALEFTVPFNMDPPVGFADVTSPAHNSSGFEFQAPFFKWACDGCSGDLLVVSLEEDASGEEGIGREELPPDATQWEPAPVEPNMPVLKPSTLYQFEICLRNRESFSVPDPNGVLVPAITEFEHFNSVLFGTCEDLSGDSDQDGICDSEDNCPFVENPGQEDCCSPGPSAVGPDGIGDACQCGDVTGDGVANSFDATMIKRQALGLSAPLFNVPKNCDVTGDGACNSFDATMITRKALGLSAPLFGNNCSNFTGEPGEF